MTRLLRIPVPGAWYQVTARGDKRRDCSARKRRVRFISQLAEMIDRYTVCLYA